MKKIDGPAITIDGSVGTLALGGSQMRSSMGPWKRSKIKDPVKMIEDSVECSMGSYSRQVGRVNMSMDSVKTITGSGILALGGGESCVAILIHIVFPSVKFSTRKHRALQLHVVTEPIYVILCHASSSYFCYTTFVRTRSNIT